MQTVALTEGGGTHSAASVSPADGRAHHHTSVRLKSKCVDTIDAKFPNLNVSTEIGQRLAPQISQRALENKSEKLRNFPKLDVEV